MTTVNTGNSTNTTTGTSGGVNLGQQGMEDILSGLGDAFGQAGVTELTPEMQAAIAAMMGQQGGGNFTGNASDFINQAGGILGGNTQLTPEQLQQQAAGLVNKDFLNNQLGQLGSASQEALTSSLGQIESGASMSGGLGSSRTALAQGTAIGDSSEALNNAQSNLVGNTYQNAMNQAMQLNQNNVNNALNQGGALGNLGTSSGQLGNNMNQTQIDAMLAAGTITQEQANNMQNSDFNKYLALIPGLSDLLGQTNSSSSNTTENSTQTQEEKDRWGELLAGIVSSGAGGYIDNMFKPKA